MEGIRIKQFENKNLSHFSYAVMCSQEKKIILIDPARNPVQYLQFARDNQADIVGVAETHPHADFVSSHLELHESLGVTIYASNMTDAKYPYHPLNEGYRIQLGKISLSTLYTPGHSPDSICLVIEHEGKQKAVFTGDTLFIGDCGRPDLRPGMGNANEEARKLASQMYHSLRDKLLTLDDDALVYPAHGAGTLCGKGLSNAQSSTIGEERNTNWSLSKTTESAFVEKLLTDQPFVPDYFPFDVELNKKGAPSFSKSINAIQILKPVLNRSDANKLEKQIWIIDIRKSEVYKDGHLAHSINLMDDIKFETWLGSIIKPGERFYLCAHDEFSLKQALERTGFIGYESQIEGGFILDYKEVTEEILDVKEFERNKEGYTIIDVRTELEVKEAKIFDSSFHIPLNTLRDRIAEIPVKKPLVVHCASGFRSAAGSSMLHSSLGSKVKVFDLGESVKGFMTQ